MASARLLGFGDVHTIDISDVYFVATDAPLDEVTRHQLTEVLVDPLLQSGQWGEPPAPPTGTVIEAALLPGVTDSVAVAVLEAATPLGVAVTAAATGRRFAPAPGRSNPPSRTPRRRLRSRSSKCPGSTTTRWQRSTASAAWHSTRPSCG